MPCCILKSPQTKLSFSFYPTMKPSSQFFFNWNLPQMLALPLISQLPLLPDIFLIGRVRSNSPNSCEPSRSNAAELRSVFSKQIPMIRRVFGWIRGRTLVVVEQWDKNPWLLRVYRGLYYTAIWGLQFHLLVVTWYLTAMENPEFHPHFLGGTIGIIHHNFYKISTVDFRCISY